MVNHVEGHHEITTKNKLFSNITQFMDSREELCFAELLPLTFCIEVKLSDVDDCSINDALSHFKSIFKLLKTHSEDLLQRKPEQEFGEPDLTAQPLRKNRQPLLLPTSHFVGSNVWILKPTGLNRGKGIHVVNSFKALKSQVKYYCQDAQKQNQMPSLPRNLVQDRKNFVIQKYIERPMLLNNRKFDIRVWALLTQDMDLYFFREGYLRLSSKPFALDNFQDEITHLTNVAIQKYSKLFGKTEDGNQLSFADLRSYMRKNNFLADFDKDVLP
jgi:hypothetical protein